MTLKQNTLLQGGKYRINRFISSGGFGCTYEAEHVMLGERVAIKEFFVKDFCNRDERTAHVTVGTQSKKGLVDKLKKKFIEEAKVLYHIQHPGIVRVFDIFEENGTAYFVMDYIDGPSLNEIVTQEGALPEARAVRYIRQVAEALKFVHSKDRLHLDIKPSNIMVDSQDNAILIDFGASKQYDEVEGENTSTLIGKTPGYAPLEQMGNDVVKFMPATDIYALGATLYKLLTGITPLSANLLASGEELEPLPKHISAATRKAVMAAMSVNKNKRPQTVEEFVKILGRIINTTITPKSQLKKPQSENNEETIIVDKIKAERDNLYKKKSVVSSETTRTQKPWGQYIRDKHPLKPILLSLASISGIGCLASLFFLISLVSKKTMYPWPAYIHGGFLWPMSFAFFIGSILLLKLKKDGFWIMSILTALSLFPIPIITKCMYWHPDVSLLSSIAIVTAMLLLLFLFYRLLKFNYKAQNIWDLMYDSTPKIRTFAIWIWIICLLLFLIPTGL